MINYQNYPSGSIDLPNKRWSLCNVQGCPDKSNNSGKNGPKGDTLQMKIEKNCIECSLSD